MHKRTKLYLEYYLTLIVLNKEGVATNMGTDNVEAVSYALAKEKKTDDFYVQNSKDYKAPLLVERLPPKMPLGGGEIATVDEVLNIT
jgi:hypothetical protein